MFQTLGQLKSRLLAAGATRIFFKALAENDNSKQQIYLGGSWEVLSFFPHGRVEEFPHLATPNFKASVDFYWLGEDFLEHAAGSQLIMYPKYPEIRLSGFLQGCKRAPKELLQPKHLCDRVGRDGRVLFFGTNQRAQVFAHLAPSHSSLAIEALSVREKGQLFTELTLAVNSVSTKAQLLAALKQAIDASPHTARRMDKLGRTVTYSNPNAAGYTLEALLGIKPNSNAAPDYLGWEIKTYSNSLITLMTPEPNGGYYGDHGVGAFVEKYGHLTANGTLYFTGNHKFELPARATGLTLKLSGFDATSGKLLDVSGAIMLLDADENVAASWGYGHLLEHWNKKHAFAAYVPSSFDRLVSQCSYRNPLLLGEHTDFARYLQTMAAGHVVYDPASKIELSNSGRPKVKARSQFRINKRHLVQLYEKFEAVFV